MDFFSAYRRGQSLCSLLSACMALCCTALQQTDALSTPAITRLLSTVKVMGRTLGKQVLTTVQRRQLLLLA